MCRCASYTIPSTFHGRPIPDTGCLHLEILRKFNFTNFPAPTEEEQKKGTNRKDFTQHMLYMTPLSISNAVSPYSTPKKKHGYDSVDDASTSARTETSHNEKKRSEFSQEPTFGHVSRDKRPLLDSYRPGQGSPARLERPMLDSYRPGHYDLAHDPRHKGRGDSYKPAYRMSAPDDHRPSDRDDITEKASDLTTGAVRKAQPGSNIAGSSGTYASIHSKYRSRRDDPIGMDEQQDVVSPLSSPSSLSSNRVTNQHGPQQSQPATHSQSGFSPFSRPPNVVSFKSRSKSIIREYEGEEPSPFTTAYSSSHRLISTAGLGLHRDARKPSVLGPTYTTYRTSQSNPSDADDEAESPRITRTRPKPSWPAVSDASATNMATHSDSGSPLGLTKDDGDDQARDLDDQGLHMHLAMMGLGKHKREASGEGAEIVQRMGKTGGEAAVAAKALGVLVDAGGQVNVAGIGGTPHGAAPSITVTGPSAATEEEGRDSKRTKVEGGRLENI